MGGLELSARAALAAVAVLTLACGTSRAPDDELGPRGRVVRPPVAHEMMRDNPELVVLDVRPFDEYQSPTGHLERAISAPLDQLPEYWALLDLRNEDTILLYGGPEGSYQSEAAQWLIERGQRFVIQIDGGIGEWTEQGFAVVVEDAPLSPVRPQ